MDFSFQLCPIQIPEEFIRSEIERKQHVIDLQNHVNNLLSKSQYDSQKQVFKNLLVHKFMVRPPSISLHAVSQLNLNLNMNRNGLQKQGSL